VLAPSRELAALFAIASGNVSHHCGCGFEVSTAFYCRRLATRRCSIAMADGRRDETHKTLESSTSTRRWVAAACLRANSPSRRLRRAARRRASSRCTTAYRISGRPPRDSAHRILIYIGESPERLYLAGKLSQRTVKTKDIRFLGNELALVSPESFLSSDFVWQSGNRPEFETCSRSPALRL